VERISAEQAAIEARLVELVGVESIQVGLKHTKISGEEDMNVDQPFEPPVSRTIEAKRKALSRFVRLSASWASQGSSHYLKGPHKWKHKPGDPQFARSYRPGTASSRAGPGEAATSRREKETLRTACEG
jgi:hypothetical protein